MSKRIVLLAGLACLLSIPSDGAERPAWTNSRFAGTPDPAPPYRVELAFPEIKFERPVDLVFSPGDDRAFVVEQAGKVYSFPNDAGAAQAELAIDLKAGRPELTAAYAIAFHPDYEQNRRAYLCYVQGSDVPDGSFISQFEVSRTDPPTIDPASEKVIYRWWAGGHNGCCLKFGWDGCLYISTGDGGGPTPPDPLAAGQDLTRPLSAVLRIDVDHADGGKPYRIPADNPFLSVPGAQPEIYAHGFRNPWRMSFDRSTGDLWVGDVGWQLWEMIYRVEKGGNYGWPIMEGPQPALPETKPGPTPILPPAVSHPHSEASSITGGFVYRGERLPDLAGAYIYGDFQSGKIWALKHDGRETTWHKEIAGTPLQIVGFGEDRSGELYILDYERSQQIFRLVPNPDDGRHEAFPRKLSETGLFVSTEQQEPAPGVVPYSINAMLWADGATSERWLALPGTDPIRLDANGIWEFPEGAVLAKTISRPLDAAHPERLHRLETQVLHREAGSWRPYSYVWNDEQTDAELAPAAGQTFAVNVADPEASGGMCEVLHHVAARAECQLCHNPWVEKKTTIYGVQSASPLAMNVSQWNRSLAGDPASPNQLASFHDRGWLDGALPADVLTAPRYVDPYDASADLNERVRSYLNVNCSHCHQPHAGGAATIELTYEVKLEDAKMLDVRPTQGAFGLAGAKVIAPGDPLASVLYYRVSKLGAGRMPRLGAEEVDEQGVRMIYDWIAQLPQPAGSPAPRVDATAVTLAALKNHAANDQGAVLASLLESTRGALALSHAIEAGDLSALARDRAIALGAEHPQGEVRDLFERYLPPARRVKRLGTAINAAELLAMAADVQRGRQTFFRDGSASCKSCHRVGGQGAQLGPDLSAIGKKYKPAELLTHLLEPSKFIEPKYAAHVIETVDGRVLTGVVVEKTDGHVVLKSVDNKEERVAMTDVETLVPQQKSLMPDLLLRDMTPQQAADLVAFLASLKEE